VLREAAGALRERDFRYLFLGRTASLLGNAFAPVALAFAVLDDLGGDATDLGLILAAAWVPQIVFTLVGGVLADRLPRNVLMLGTDLMMFVAQGVVAVLLLTDRAEIWHVAALQALRGIATAFFFPASVGLVPQVVSAGRLQQANALLRLSQSSTQIFGAALAGIAVASVGSGWAIAFDALTFLASAALLAQIRLPRARAKAKNLVRELREGWDEFRSREWLWVIVAAAAIGNFANAIGIVVLGPVVANEELGGATTWGLYTASISVGLLVGGLVVLRFRPERPLLVAQLAVLLAFAQFLALAFAAPIPVLLLAGLIAGFGFELFGVLWDTALQQHVPGDRLSRVSAWDQLGSFVVIPIGLTVAGPLAAHVGTEEAILLAGGLFLGVQSLALLSRDVRTLRRTDHGSDELPPMPPRTLPQEEASAEIAASG
jgi:predicted MFS family arabinose efflux permease